MDEGRGEAFCIIFNFVHSNSDVVTAKAQEPGGTAIFSQNVFARYSLAIRLKSLPLYERACALIQIERVHERRYTIATLMPGSATYFHDETVRRLRYFPSRQINFHRDIPVPASRRRPAGWTIENLARGCTRISRFMAPPASATPPCFRCPRGRRHVCLSTSVSTASEISRPRPFPSGHPRISYDRARVCVCVRVREYARAHVCIFVCMCCVHMYISIYMHVGIRLRLRERPSLRCQLRVFAMLAQACFQLN